jgi:hypothetical protein
MTAQLTGVTEPAPRGADEYTIQTRTGEVTIGLDWITGEATREWAGRIDTRPGHDHWTVSYLDNPLVLTRDQAIEAIALAEETALGQDPAEGAYPQLQRLRARNHAATIAALREALLRRGAR